MPIFLFYSNHSKSFFDHQETKTIAATAETTKTSFLQGGGKITYKLWLSGRLAVDDPRSQHSNGVWASYDLKFPQCPTDIMRWALSFHASQMASKKTTGCPACPSLGYWGILYHWKIRRVWEAKVYPLQLRQLSRFLVIVITAPGQNRDIKDFILLGGRKGKPKAKYSLL